MSENHAAPLAGGWKIWRSIWLRSAGFPAAHVLRLAATKTSAELDALALAERAADSAGDAAVAVLQPATETATDGSGRLIGAAIKKIKKRTLPDAIPNAPPAVAGAIESYSRAFAAVEELRARAKASYAEETLRIAEALRESARDAKFREALLWQNRSALHGTIAALLRKPAGAVDSKTREHERLVANYLQRYCTKNETIGFFGPVAWASFDERASAGLSLRPGRGLLSKRTVYFEHWGIDTLAEVIAAQPELRPTLAPRRLPNIRAEGATLYHSFGKTSPISPAFSALLALCDGDTPARAIAEKLLADPALELSDEDEVYEMLDGLVEKRLAVWTLELPVWNPHPEAKLKSLLEALPENAARARGLEMLAQLDRGRNAIADAAGKERELDLAIGDLETAFHSLTGEAGTRRGGQVYAGRTLFYEDCVRDVDCVLGGALLERLHAPLEMLLASARWYTAEIARRYRADLRALFDTLSAELGAAEVDYLTFWHRAEPLFAAETGAPPIVRDVTAELQSRWRTILAPPEGAHRVFRSSKDLAGAARDAFAAPGPGWPSARFHSPDLMLAAANKEAVERGECFFVLGELHVAVISQFSQVGVYQHPDPEQLFTAGERDLQELCVTPVESKVHATRADYLPLKRHDPQIETGVTRSPQPRDKVIAAGDLVIAKKGDQLVVRARDGRLELESLSFFGQYLSFGSISDFRVLPPATRTPRVQIDEMVIERERWTFAPESLTFTAATEPWDRFAGARAWVRENQLPRFVFARVPEERKPFYVDFESPVYVEILCTRVRKASGLSMTEMLPTLEQLWLIDGEGNGYTSELRTVAVDPIKYSGAE